MKRTASSILDAEGSRLNKILFKKSEDLVASLKPEDDVHEENILDRKPVWDDEDDENFKANTIPSIKSELLYVDKLKQKYENLMGTPGWAKINKNDKTEDRDADDQILRTVGHLHNEPITRLKSNYIQLKKLPKINAVTHIEGPIISCIEFHPKSSVALVAGQSGVVSLFSVGGDENNKLHNFKLKKWKISTADFAPCGKVAYISSTNYHKYCIYDLMKAEPQLVQLPQNVKRPMAFKLSPDGNFIATCDGFDEVFIICTGSRELLRSLKHNNVVTSLCFSHDSKQLFTFGVQGEVIIWDLSTFRVVKKFYDQGCVTASYITTSPCGRLIATGSGEGIVNIYQTANLTSTEAVPLKTISNLRTKITRLKFNPATEILAINSSMYPNAAKLIHIPSYHVFMNFPNQEQNLHQVDVISFSPNSGYMGIGNNKGSAFLYRLKHYNNY